MLNELTFPIVGDISVHCPESSTQNLWIGAKTEKLSLNKQISIQFINIYKIPIQHPVKHGHVYGQ